MVATLSTSIETFYLSTGNRNFGMSEDADTNIIRLRVSIGGSFVSQVRIQLFFHFFKHLIFFPAVLALHSINSIQSSASSYYSSPSPPPPSHLPCVCRRNIHRGNTLAVKHFLNLFPSLGDTQISYFLSQKR